MTAEHSTTDKTTVELKPKLDDDRQQPDRAFAEQEELWRRYLQQRARRSCPACGDADDTVL